MRNLKTIDEQMKSSPVAAWGALVAPTGIGKTTTVAKLAARATLRHGTERIALITTDSYRIGAQGSIAPVRQDFGRVGIFGAKRG